jgi:hypothetical protein
MEWIKPIYVLSGIFFGISLTALGCAIALVYIFRNK